MKSELRQSEVKPYSRTMLIATIVFVATVAGVGVNWRAPRLEFTSRDWLMRMRGNLPQLPTDNSDLVIVAIDEASIARFGRFPWSRSLMAEAIANISRANPKTIALDVLFTDASQAADDASLVAAIASAKNVIVAAQLAETTNATGETGNVWLRPLPAIERAAAAIGHVNIMTGYDSIARALVLKQTDDEANALWAMAIETIRCGEKLDADSIRELPDGVQLGRRTIPVSYDLPQNTLARLPATSPIETIRASQIWLDFVGPSGSFAAQTVSISEAIDGTVPAEKLRGKYVLIGATATALGDRVASPFARDGGREELMPGVEVLANSLNTILQNRFYRETPFWMAFLLAALVAAATVLALSLSEGRFAAIKHLLALAGLIGAIVLLSYFAFNRWLIFPPLVPALVSLMVAAPLALLRRSLKVSANIDRHIAELSETEATLMTARNLGSHQNGHEVGRVWKFKLPRGGEWKAQRLGSIAGRIAERARYIEQSMLSVEDGLLVANVSGQISFANRRAAEIFGKPQSSMIGSNLFALLAEAELQAKVEQVREKIEHQILPVEREITIGTISPKHYVLKIAAVSEEGKTEPLGLVISLSDITRQRELQQARNDVMALVTHELKTPLTAIQGMSGLLARFEVDPERRREMHLAINDEARRLARMIDEYLNITRLETGAQPLRLSATRPAQLIERALLMLDPLAAQREIRIVRRFADELPVLTIDADLIAQAITNLVSNAIKFSPNESEVFVEATRIAEGLRIAVTDSGCGIPPESLPRVFEKFYRVPAVENADVPGTGLGLTLVREISERHGGKVTAESKPGTGSVFTLYLPV
ncbi:MAG: CHASE2 domain-containing protein [Acidobacteriota bacterium]|nr:CHASE2 domain-containing protein [Acidobacteriota bacterium]